MSKTNVVFLAAALQLATLAHIAHAELKLHVIDVGQAASTLVELDHAAILIDAGGEDTGSTPRDAKSIRDALTTFFARRTDLHNTLDAVIVSHPHLDHTMNLMVVMKEFTVRALIDNGDLNPTASGIKPLNDARAFVKQKNIRYIAVADDKIPAGGQVLDLSPGVASGAASGAQITLLSGFRNCTNRNNDSIAVLIVDGNASALFAGDAESDDDDNNKKGKCDAEPQLQHLEKLYGQTKLRDIKLYHATHHGSKNGVLAALMAEVHPAASVISAGRLEKANQKPGDFHAFQFGHPRKEAIDSLTQSTTGSRTPKQVAIMTKVKGKPVMIEMKKAVYCTCWDGNIDITFAADGAPAVTPLGAKHAPDGPIGDGSVRPGTGPACKIAPADLFTPTIKNPDSVNKKTADYYMLSLSWSPQFCTTSAGKSAANQFQCKENSFGMVVHGLWPQSATAKNNNEHPRNCKTTTPIAAETLRQTLCTVPGVQLMQDEWAKHGTCAFDTPEKYFSTVRSLMGDLHIPDMSALGKKTNLVARDVIDAFVKANAGLAAADVQLLTTGKNLGEVHVCYGMDLKFRKCDTKASVASNAKISIQPMAH